MRIFLLALVVGGALLMLVPPAAQADVQFGPFDFPTKKRVVGVHRPVYQPHCPSGTDYYCGPPVYTPRCPTIRVPRVRPKFVCRWCFVPAVRPCFRLAVPREYKRWRHGYIGSAAYPGGHVDHGAATVVRPRSNRYRCR